MPRFDGTGPFGQGPMGRGLGPCGAGRRSGCGYRIWPGLQRSSAIFTRLESAPLGLGCLERRLWSASVGRQVMPRLRTKSKP